MTEKKNEKVEQEVKETPEASVQEEKTPETKETPKAEKPTEEPKEEAVEETSEKAAHELGIEYTLKKVSDVKDIMKYGVMMTPALVVDGEVKISGKVPSLDEVKKMLQD